VRRSGGCSTLWLEPGDGPTGSGTASHAEPRDWGSPNVRSPFHARPPLPVRPVSDRPSR
jgi:hypothetical protein